MGNGGSILALHHLLWEVRLTVLLDMAHWKLRAADVWTVAPGAPISEQVTRLLDCAAAYGNQSKFQA